MAYTRKRAPSGWRRIAWTDYEAAVFVPKTAEIRKKSFRDCVAFVVDGAVFVRNEDTWNTREDVRRHEIEHLKQRQFFGPELYEFLYAWLHDVSGYKQHPFEVLARKAEKKKG